MKTLLLVLLSGCVADLADPPAPPSEPQSFSCETAYWCDGLEYKGGAETCGVSRDEVETAWRGHCAAAAATTCSGVLRCEITCMPVGAACQESL